MAASLLERVRLVHRLVPVSRTSRTINIIQKRYDIARRGKIVEKIICALPDYFKIKMGIFYFITEFVQSSLFNRVSLPYELKF